MKVKVENLTPHIKNKEIYDLTNIEDLINSIKEFGLLNPIVVNQDLIVISGHRRLESIKRLGWKEVEVDIKQTNNIDEEVLLIHHNKQRIKTYKELLNEYNVLLKNYSKGQGKRSDLTSDNVVRGSTRDILSKLLGMSSGQLQKLLFIHKEDSKYIKLLDDGVVTVNQLYIQLQRRKKENLTVKSKYNYNNKNNTSYFKFYQKSSDNMSELEDHSIQTIFTSPPYPNSIRRYDREKGIGNEDTIEEYVENLSKHLDDCYRVLKPTGSFFLNLGDVFINGCLQSAPHKVLFKLLERKNYTLRNTIFFSKSNPKPSSSKSNHTPSYEYVFFLTKSMKYDFERVLMPIKDNDKSSHPPRHRSGKNDIDYTKISTYISNKKGKSLPDYWDEDIIRTSVSNQRKNMGIENPATFPISLLTIPILQTSVLPFLKKGIEPENIENTILDPFCGSLSTFECVKKINQSLNTNLKFVGYDLKKYF